MSKTNLIESLLDLHHPFEAAVLCTYGLNLNFMENYLLDLSGLGACNSIALFVDAATYDGFAGSSYVPRKLNRRYLVTPIRAAGVFHTKLYVLASPRKAVITVGSANLTREGIAGNLELLTTIEISQKNSEFAPLLRDCLNYLRRLADLSGSEQAAEQVATLAHICAPLLVAADHHDNVRLIHNLDRPILESILDQAANMPMNRVLILSPFYDTALAPLKALRERLPTCAVEFCIQQRKSNFPVERLRFGDQGVTVTLYRDLDRYLHGKAIILEGGETALLYMGSANFTSAAMLASAGPGNYEIGLIGRVPASAVQDLVRPAGSIAVAVGSLDEIEVDRRDEPKPPHGPSYIDYLVEAVEESKDAIRVHVRSDIGPDVFQPKRYCLTNFTGESKEGPYDPSHTIVRDAKDRQRFAGVYAVELIGVNSRRETVRSNRIWVIALEEPSSHSAQRTLRRISQDPGQLIQILQEIAARGDEHEVMRFLAQFDIPLDLILPPSIYGRPRNLRSKGNLIGTLPFHRAEFLSSNVLAAFEACLKRLLDKMKAHRKHLQSDRIGNFALIYSCLLALLTYLNEWAEKRYEGRATINPDDWLSIRDCYNMLVRYSSEAWELVWGKDGYRNAINAKPVRHDEDEPLVRFDEVLLALYNNSPAQFTEVLGAPLQTFSELHNRLRVRNRYGDLVQPRIFPNNHDYLQPDTRTSIQTEQLERTTRLLRSIPQPAYA